MEPTPDYLWFKRVTSVHSGLGLLGEKAGHDSFDCVHPTVPGGCQDVRIHETKLCGVDEHSLRSIGTSGSSSCLPRPAPGQQDL